MSQPNQTSKLAVMQNAKPQFPEFEKFAESIKSQERAKFAYEMKHGLRNNRAKDEKPKETAQKLLKKARTLILKHEKQAGRKQLCGRRSRWSLKTPACMRYWVRF